MTSVSPGLSVPGSHLFSYGVVSGYQERRLHHERAGSDADNPARQATGAEVQP
jgi:hypothetical protein